MDRFVVPQSRSAISAHDNRKAFFVVLLTLGLLLFPFTAISYAVVTPAGKVERQSPQVSHRLIIQLTSPSLAEMSATTGRSRLTNGRLDVDSLAARTYVAKLKAEQSAFVIAMRQALPTASVATYTNEQGQSVQAAYQIVFNGLAIDPGMADLDQARLILARLPGVQGVSTDDAHRPTLYASLPLINAPTLWSNQRIGGQSNAGVGIKVASMDGGVHKDAPMFDGTGYGYPTGYPLGDTSNTNGKIIVSRAYFRDWDPPASGDENSWPGVAGTSHGVHTAGIAAGNPVTATYLGHTTQLSGVAPKAWVMSYRIFYESESGDSSFYDAEGIAALEDIVRDGADIVNSAWDGGPSSTGGPFDPLDTALRNAVSAGVFVSLSAGNSGPYMSTSNHPSAEYIVAAATTTSGTLATGRMSVSAPEPISPTLQNIPHAKAAFGGSITTGQVYSYTFIAAEVISPTNFTGCTPWPAGTFNMTGKPAVAALISQGSCEFGVKILNAQQAGAEFVVIHGNANNGERLITMSPGAVGNQVTIPAIFIGYSRGTAMREWYRAHGSTSMFTLNMFAFQASSVADVVTSFSSRGPGMGNVLKPDIAAPGANILSQGYMPNVTGEARHLGYGQVSGTSMAASHVAGAAALLQQIHPTWTPAEIRSALMSTAKYMNIWTQEGLPAQPLDMGAGRLDLARAADPGVILEPPSLGFALVPTSTTRSMIVTVRNISSASETYALRTLYTGGGFTSTTSLPGFTVTPSSITLAPQAVANVVVTFNSRQGRGLGDNQGYLILDGSTHEAHLPLWARVTNPTARSDILIIDNDFSSTPRLLPDYLGYYTSTLEALGYSYTVLDVDALAGSSEKYLDPAALIGYDAILYFTGNNVYQASSLPLTEHDTYALNQYAHNGGTIIAMGQDLSKVLQSTTPATTQFFYNFTLGGEWLSDSVTNGVTLTIPISSTSALPLAGVNLDLSWGTGDGADNQASIDEIAATQNITDSVADPAYQAVLHHRHPTNKDKGVVAMMHREQPTLENPGVSFAGRTFYATFGLEGVNNRAGVTTREQLMQRVLNWAWDTPMVEVEVASAETKYTFAANFTSNISGVRAMSYRWDFGDGSPITSSGSNSIVTHTYDSCLSTTVVWVEVLDSLGNRTVNKVTDFCVAATSDYYLYLPLMRR